MVGQARARFAADAMLGSLARKLRIFGFDTYYHQSGTDAALMDIARRQKRVILTADRLLFESANRRDITSLFISGRTDAQRLRCLVHEAEQAAIALDAGESRCAVCNGTLTTVGRGELAENGGVAGNPVTPEIATKAKPQRKKAEASQAAPPLGRHRRYFVCTTCGKVYWRGSHWSRLRRLSKLLPGPAKEI